MSDATNEQQNGFVPEHVLNQLNEHAVGGFVLFYFNADTGIPSHVTTFDSPAHCLALQKYVEEWSEALHKVNVLNAMSAIQQSQREAEQQPPEQEPPEEAEQ